MMGGGEIIASFLTKGPSTIRHQCDPVSSAGIPLIAHRIGMCTPSAVRGGGFGRCRPSSLQVKRLGLT